MTDQVSLKKLQTILAKLRGEGGCAWSQEQTFDTIAPYTLEEAYEVLAAIREQKPSLLCDELGDLLLQVVFHARIAEEQKLFDLNDVITAIVTKIERRNPHIFGDESDRKVLDKTRTEQQWQVIKQQESADSAGRESSALDGITSTLPALKRAQKIQEKAAQVGFDWPDPEPVYAKVEEEIAELRETVNDSRDRQEDELGDLLFAVVNLARHHGLDAEQALLRAGDKFKRRFLSIEESLASVGRSPSEASLEEMETLWQHAKAQE